MSNEEAERQPEMESGNDTRETSSCQNTFPDVVLADKNTKFTKTHFGSVVI